MAATTAEDAKKGYITDTTLYTNLKNDIYTEIDKLLSNANRFQSIKERREESVFDMETFKKISKGKFNCKHQLVSFQILNIKHFEALTWLAGEYFWKYFLK